MLAWGQTDRFITLHKRARKNIGLSDTDATLNQNDRNGEIEALITEAQRLNNIQCTGKHHCELQNEERGCSETVQLSNGRRSADYGENLFAMSKCVIAVENGRQVEKCLDPD